MNTKRSHGHDLDCPIIRKKMRTGAGAKIDAKADETFTGCFSFCIYNNALYDMDDKCNYFEKRYLVGLLYNIKKINALSRKWTIIVYADHNLQHYYSSLHKKQFVSLLLEHDNIEIHWVVNKYIKHTAFALERYRAISNPKYSIVVVRDVDQLITSLDISNINHLIDSDRYDTLCYRTLSMTFICGGGGFATKKTGQTYIDDEELRHTHLPRYINNYYQDGVGYEEYWITLNHTHKKINLGVVNTVITKFNNGGWYVGDNAIFMLPYC